MNVKHIIKSWVTTLVSIVLFSMVTYKVYFMFETLTIAQASIILFMYMVAGGLLFASDKVFKDTFKKLTSKLTSNGK